MTRLGILFIAKKDKSICRPIVVYPDMAGHDMRSSFVKRCIFIIGSYGDSVYPQCYAMSRCNLAFTGIRY